MTPFVPVQTAADVLARSVNTIRTWARRAQVRSARDPDTGELLVHWLDVRREDEGQPRDQPVTADLAAAYLAAHTCAQPVTTAMIRTWAWRKRVTRVGTDTFGRALYDLTTVVDEARRRGMLTPNHTGVIMALTKCVQNQGTRANL